MANYPVSQKVAIGNPGNTYVLKVNADGSIDVNASVSASIGAFEPTGQAALAVSSSTGRVALGSTDGTVLVQNTGTVTAYIKFGTVAVTAATTDYPILGGSAIGFATDQTYIAAITASSTTNLLITSGAGLAVVAYSGGGSSAGSVTPSDNFANPSTAIASYSLAGVWDGSTWDRLPGNSAGGAYVQGPAADDAAAAGNPVGVGGIYNTTLPTYSNLDQTKFQFGTRGSANVTLFPQDSANSITARVSNADAVGVNTNAINLATSSLTYVYNGTSFDRARGDTVGTYTVETPTTAAANSITPTATTVAASNLVLKSGAGNFYGANIVTGAAAGYVMLFNATALPSNGTVTPLKCWAVSANSSLEIGYDIPIRCGTGITLGFSTTGPFTLTASGTAFISGEAV